MFLKNNDHSGSFIEPCRKSYNREVKFNPSGRPGQTRFLNISWPQPFNVHLKAGPPAGNQDKKGNVVSYRIGGESTQYILPVRSSRKKYRDHSWKIDYYPVQEKKVKTRKTGFPRFHPAPSGTEARLVVHLLVEGEYLPDKFRAILK